MKLNIQIILPIPARYFILHDMFVLVINGSLPCGVLNNPKNGVILYYDEGRFAEYKCNSGYHLQRRKMNNFRECTRFATWTGTGATCIIGSRGK